LYWSRKDRIRVRLNTASYQELINDALNVALDSDRSLLRALSQWLNDRVAQVAATYERTGRQSAT
jgi:hypothetical protein